MATYSAKESDIEKKWILIDADGIVLGRLASLIASNLRGKNKVIFTPHMDCGDNIIVINADKIYYWHTGYPGGIKSKTANEILDGKFPERVLQKAVQRMMPGGPLSRKQLKNLKIYAGSNHPHEAQQPQILDFGSLNVKNKRRVS